MTRLNKLFRFCFLVGLILLLGVGQAQTTETVLKQLVIQVDAVDPTPANDPKGANYPGNRGAEQLVIYTPTFGISTETNGYGKEAVIVNGEVSELRTADSPIPANGFVVSGHGQSGSWVERILKRGAHVEINPDTRTLTVEITPHVYILGLSDTLDRVLAISATEPSMAYTNAKVCLDALKLNAETLSPPALETESAHCQQLATEAYYQAVPSYPNEFRGIWLRPTEQTPQAIAKTIQGLKADHIHDIFLETYYQGRTLYPSAVMKTYGLPDQQEGFRGWDPLQAWVATAKANNIKLHAWVQVYFAGNREVSPEPYGPILTKYPAWSNIARWAVNVDHPPASMSEPGHFFIDPANPQAKAFLEQLMAEIATNYDIDGINLDYIRYPASQPPTTSGYLASTWGYTPQARADFQAELQPELLAWQKAHITHKQVITGYVRRHRHRYPVYKAVTVIPTLPNADPVRLTPASPHWDRWVEWRKNQVDSFVQTLSEEVHHIKPGILISAVVFYRADDPNHAIKLQDWPKWVQMGWVQALTPIGLGDTPEEIKQTAVAINHQTQGKIPVYAGIFGMYNKVPPVEFIDQIESIHQAGLPGLILFERAHMSTEYQNALLKGSFRE